MKKLLLILIAVISIPALLQAAPTKYVSKDKWYLSGALGYGIPTDDDISTSAGTAALESDPGINFVVAGGHNWNGMRVELEYSHRRTDGLMRSSSATLDGNKAHLVFNSVMVNFVYDYPLNEKLYWFNGLGVGVVWVNLESLSNDDTDAQFGWQLMTGFGYKLTRELSLTATYRLHTSRNSSFSNASTTFNVDTPYLNIFELGLRYDF